jgi:tRNA (cytidine/uridine-2'-O-)-methyltransferase
MRIALFQPEIAGNVGAILRLGACFGVAVDLHVAIARHGDFEAFRSSIGSRRLVLFTTKAEQSRTVSRSRLTTSFSSGRKARECRLL